MTLFISDVQHTIQGDDSATDAQKVQTPPAILDSASQSSKTSVLQKGATNIFSVIAK